MDLNIAISTLVQSIPDASSGLPDEVFYFISRTTPLVNVDMLIKDEHNRTLLSWRDDQHVGKGWHIPGGIVRFKETLEARIDKVAISEIGCAVRHDPAPIAVNQMIHTTRDIRGHFLSFLYKCYLPASFQPENKGLLPHFPGYLAWHENAPHDLLPVHEVYRTYIEGFGGTPTHDIIDEVMISAVLPSERGV